MPTVYLIYLRTDLRMDLHKVALSRAGAEQWVQDAVARSAVVADVAERMQRMLVTWEAENPYSFDEAEPPCPQFKKHSRGRNMPEIFRDEYLVFEEWEQNLDAWRARRDKVITAHRVARAQARNAFLATQALTPDEVRRLVGGVPYDPVAATRFCIQEWEAVA